MLPLLTFEPIFQERVWGGRRLESLFGKALPPDVPIGESWEVSDRPGAVSVIADGSLAGRDLRWLMEQHETDLLGDVPSADGWFPWLAKLLDASADLSVQVHPPDDSIGEPKTEAWHIAHAEPDARLIAGLKTGTSREQFEVAIGQPNFAECLHEIPTNAGDSIFIPSGRLHALGAGTVVFEIQQNSDTTFRVFDWNRVGLDGQPRELHVDAALRSIDFGDFEPEVQSPEWQSNSGFSTYAIAEAASVFRLEQVRLETPNETPLPGNGLRLIAVTAGELVFDGSITLKRGAFAVVPASLANPRVAGAGAEFLLTQSP